MQAINHHVQGALLVEEGHVVVLLQDTEPFVESAASLYLRYAFTAPGIEESIFPAFLLDDWGNEIGGVDLYDWVSEFGDQFPRAELFGFGLDGKTVQCFLRELESDVRLPCYAYQTKDAPLSDGMLVEAMALPDDSIATARKLGRPAMVKRPLCLARVSWWRVHPGARPLGLSFD